MGLSKELESAVADLQKRMKLLEGAESNINEIALTVGDIVGRWQALDNRVKFLESENARLKANGSNATTPVEQPKRDGEPGRVVEPERGASVRRVYYIDTHGLTEDKSRKLLAIATGRWNMFGNIPHDEFHRAMIAVLNMKRLPDQQVDTKYSLSWWSDNLESWARANGMPGSISALAILAACVSCGDVSYTSPENWPHIEFGLAAPHFSGRATNNAWRDLLAGGRLLEPVHVKRELDQSLGYQSKVRYA